MAFGFRPGDPAIPLAAPLDAAHGVNPKEPQTTLEVPEADVMNAVLDAWEGVKKNARVVLAIDVSGSMNDEGKIGAARDGAAAFVGSLGDKDEMALMTFNSKTSWALPLANVGASRDRLNSTISGLFAQGGTSLYDAVGEAYDSIAKTPAGSKITALVVLSDGADRDSRMGLSELLQKIRFDSEGAGVRVFTIGYGSDAKSDVLEKIADTTQGRYYAGKPENIRAVFKEISTFF